MTEGIMSTVAEWTGDRPVSCPWRVFHDLFVQRVQSAHRAFESGNLAALAPNMSHRLAEGLLHYDSVMGRCSAMRMKQDAEARKRG